MNKIFVLLLFITIVFTSCDQGKVSDEPIEPETPIEPEIPVVKDKFVIGDEVSLNISGWLGPDNVTPIKNPSGDVLFNVATDWLEDGKGVDLSIDPDTKNLVLTRTGPVPTSRMWLPIFWGNSGEGPRTLTMKVKASKDSIIATGYSRDDIDIKTETTTIVENYIAKTDDYDTFYFDLSAIEEGVVITIESFDIKVSDRFVIADPVSITIDGDDRSFTPIQNPESEVLFYIDNTWIDAINEPGKAIEIEEGTKNLKITINTPAQLTPDSRLFMFGHYPEGSMGLKMRIKSSTDIKVCCVYSVVPMPISGYLVTGGEHMVEYSRYISNDPTRPSDLPYLLFTDTQAGTVITIETFFAEIYTPQP